MLSSVRGRMFPCSLATVIVVCVILLGAKIVFVDLICVPLIARSWVPNLRDIYGICRVAQ